jgi:hypothetical protein
LHAKVILLFVLAVVLAGCAGKPYKIDPSFYERHEEFQRIGFYPLVYRCEGIEQRMFGNTFDDVFYSAAVTLPMNGSVRLEKPEVVLEALEAKGVHFVDSTYVPGAIPAKFPSYRYPTKDELIQISDDFDAVIVPVLIDYNEVETGEQVAQMFLTTCLTLGYVTASEENTIKAELVMLDTKSQTRLWWYTAYYSGGMGLQRVNFSNRLSENFGKYFPLSATFES